MTRVCSSKDKLVLVRRAYQNLPLNDLVFPTHKGISGKEYRIADQPVWVPRQSTVVSVAERPITVGPKHTVSAVDGDKGPPCGR